MRFLLPLLLSTSSIFAQTNCQDFFALLGERDVSEKVQHFLSDCGPFEETPINVEDSKTLVNKEKGIQIMFINREPEDSSLPKYEVLSIKLSTFTIEGGYTGEIPFGFVAEMDYRLVQAHIMGLEDVYYEKEDLSKESSAFTYTGAKNPKLQGKKVKVYISQFDENAISYLRMRVK